jgi:O-Antigen ligase
MSSIANYGRGRGLGLALGEASPLVRRSLFHYPTTTVERFLLMATTVLLPLQDHIPAVAGFSIMFIMFAILAGYILLNRARALARTWLHPVFLAAYALLIGSLLIESAHPYSDYSFIFRLGQAIAGAIIVASLCRDRQALQAAIYGCLVAGVWMSVLLFFTSFGALSGATATNFNEATRLRSQVFAENPLEANLNFMGFIAAQGTAVALALALTTRSSHRRYLLLGITAMCFVATFLPLSRSAIVIVILACGAILFAYGAKQLRTLMIAIILGATMVIWVPDAVFSRLTFSTESYHGKMEARARVYTAAIEHLPEYAMTGVGVGNFYGQWGMQSGFFSLARGSVTGPHNWYFAVAIYWGVGGLLALLVMIYQAYRCLPRRCSADPLGLCLLGIAVSLFLFTMVQHVLANKVVFLGLGLLVGVRLWIWPYGTVQSASRQHPCFRIPLRRRS